MSIPDSCRWWRHNCVVFAERLGATIGKIMPTSSKPTLSEISAELEGRMSEDENVWAEACRQGDPRWAAIDALAVLLLHIDRIGYRDAAGLRLSMTPQFERAKQVLAQAVKP